MTARDLKEWLQDVPDDARILAAPHDAPENTYGCEPIFRERRT